MKFVKKTDIIIIILLFVVALVSYFSYKFIFSDVPAVAQIYYEAKLVRTVDLSKNEDYTFRLAENEDVLIHVFADGSIAFEESDCHDKICINSGKLDTVGQSAACLPNKIVIKIVATTYSDDKPDLIV